MTDSGASIGVWILGATGRVGRAVAAKLAQAEVSPVLVGRDPGRLSRAAEGAGDRARTLVAASTDAAAAEIRRQRPAVVVNTIGPFSRTALPIARACLPGSHYVDLANDLVAVSALLGMHDEAVAAGRTLVTGAGFGVLATEAVVAALCRDRPAPSAVRVDAVPSVAMEAGELGAAFAATLVDGVRIGGRRYANGRLEKVRLGGDVQRLTLPDGQTTRTAAAPTGELVAARNISGAPSVVATSGLAPTAPAARAVLPLATALLSLRPVRDLARRRLARIHIAARGRARASTPGDTPSSTGRTAPAGKAGCARATAWTSRSPSSRRRRSTSSAATDGPAPTPRRPPSGPTSPSRRAAPCSSTDRAPPPRGHIWLTRPGLRQPYVSIRRRMEPGRPRVDT